MKWILLLVVIAGVAGFFTRPDEPKMQAAADAVLSERAEQAIENLDVGAMAESGATAMFGNRNYTNYYVAARYLVTRDNAPVVTCWGAFTQVQCNLAAEEAAAT